MLLNFSAYNFNEGIKIFHCHSIYLSLQRLSQEILVTKLFQKSSCPSLGFIESTFNIDRQGQRYIPLGKEKRNDEITGKDSLQLLTGKDF